MKPHTRKLYQLVRAKLHLGERDGMKFIHGIQEEEIHISFTCVIRAIGGNGRIFIPICQSLRFSFSEEKHPYDRND